MKVCLQSQSRQHFTLLCSTSVIPMNLVPKNCQVTCVSVFIPLKISQKKLTHVWRFNILRHRDAKLRGGTVAHTHVNVHHVTDYVKSGSIKSGWSLCNMFHDNR